MLKNMFKALESKDCFKSDFGLSRLLNMTPHPLLKKQIIITPTSLGCYQI